MMICGRTEYIFAYQGKTIKALLLLLLSTVYFLSSSRDTSSEDSYVLISRTQIYCATADAIVVGGVLLPHGDFALDPSFFRNGTVERDVANDVAKGARRAGRWLVELQQQTQKHPGGAYKYQNKIIHPHETKNETTRCVGGSDSDCYIVAVEDEEALIVLMTTPHGIKLDNDYGIYVSSRGSGTATIGGDCIGFRDNAFGYNIGRERKISNIRKGAVVSKESLSNATTTQHDRHPCQHKSYNVTLNNIDLAPTALARDLLTFLHQEKNHPVSGVYSYDDETPIPLNWGEIVPLLLLPTINPHDSAITTPSVSSSSSLSKILSLIWTFPYRRYNHSVEMVPELLQVGADIMDWAQQRPERIAILVSGDLSHTHQSSGPYGYSAASGFYDDAIGRWAGGNGTSEGSRHGSWDPCQPEATAALLNRAKELQPDAKSCGFTGYVMWHGMMCATSSSIVPSLTFLSPTSMTSNVSAKDDNDSKSNKRTIKKDRAIKFDSKVFVNRNVTYYGMIGAIFEPYYVG
jgi:aromatic ring-opening dioxygenase LigB subunit